MTETGTVKISRRYFRAFHSRRARRTKHTLHQSKTKATEREIPKRFYGHGLWFRTPRFPAASERGPVRSRRRERTLTVTPSPRLPPRRAGPARTCDAVVLRGGAGHAPRPVGRELRRVAVQPRQPQGTGAAAAAAASRRAHGPRRGRGRGAEEPPRPRLAHGPAGSAPPAGRYRSCAAATAIFGDGRGAAQDAVSLAGRADPGPGPGPLGCTGGPGWRGYRRRRLRGAPGLQRNCCRPRVAVPLCLTAPAALSGCRVPL